MGVGREIDAYTLSAKGGIDKYTLWALHDLGERQEIDEKTLQMRSTLGAMREIDETCSRCDVL